MKPFSVSVIGSLGIQEILLFFLISFLFCEGTFEVSSPGAESETNVMWWCGCLDADEILEKTVESVKKWDIL